MRAMRAWIKSGRLPFAGFAATLTLLAFSGLGRAANSVTVRAEDVAAKVALPQTQAAPGAQLQVAITFDVGPGWHIYGAPLPPDFTVTKVTFDDQLLQSQSIKFPAPTPLEFKALNQTFPVYSGKFDAQGRLALKPDLKPGDYQLTGTIEFQQCNDLECKIPQKVPFQLPLKIS